MTTFSHRDRTPRVDPSAYVAPTAVLCGDVDVGPGVRVLFGAVITAEDGRVVIGENSVVMENALVRGRAATPASIGANVLVGPHAHVNGAVIGDGAFIATGAALFPGAQIGRGAEVRIGGVVHVNTVLPDDAVVPIHWVAVGDPAQLFSPDRHDEIWAVQRELDFPGTVYGLPRDATPEQLMQRQSQWFGAHVDDHET